MSTLQRRALYVDAAATSPTRSRSRDAPAAGSSAMPSEPTRSRSAMQEALAEFDEEPEGFTSLISTAGK
jgi:hypothetical protein